MQHSSEKITNAQTEQLVRYQNQLKEKAAIERGLHKVVKFKAAPKPEPGKKPIPKSSPDDYVPPPKPDKSAGPEMKSLPKAPAKEIKEIKDLEKKAAGPSKPEPKSGGKKDMESKSMLVSKGAVVIAVAPGPVINVDKDVRELLADMIVKKLPPYKSGDSGLAYGLDMLKSDRTASQKYYEFEVAVRNVIKDLKKCIKDLEESCSFEDESEACDVSALGKTIEKSKGV